MRSSFFLRQLIYLVALLAFGASCKTYKGPPKVTIQAITSQPADTVMPAYRLKVGDDLMIRNLNWLDDLVPEATSQAGQARSGFRVRVDAEGQIGLPEVGKIYAIGLTRQQLADTLGVLFKNVINNPIFEVVISNLGVKVLGAVTTQGVIQLDNEYETLGEILSRSGGLRYTESDSKIQIIRGNGKSQKIIEYSLQDLGAPLVMNQLVYDNDIVYVPPTKNVVSSYRLQRNLIVAQPILTLLNMTLIVFNVIRSSRAP